MIEGDGDDVAHQAVVGEAIDAEDIPPHVAEGSHDEECGRPATQGCRRSDVSADAVAATQGQIEACHQGQHGDAAIEQQEKEVVKALGCVHLPN